MQHRTRQTLIAAGAAVLGATALLAAIPGVRFAGPVPVEQHATQLTALDQDTALDATGGVDVAEARTFLDGLGLSGLVDAVPGLATAPGEDSLAAVLLGDAATPILFGIAGVMNAGQQAAQLGQVFDSDVQDFTTNFDIGDFGNLGTDLINDVGPDLIGWVLPIF